MEKILLALYPLYSQGNTEDTDSEDFTSATWATSSDDSEIDDSGTEGEFVVMINDGDENEEVVGPIETGLEAKLGHLEDEHRREVAMIVLESETVAKTLHDLRPSCVSVTHSLELEDEDPFT